MYVYIYCSVYNGIENYVCSRSEQTLKDNVFQYLANKIKSSGSGHLCSLLKRNEDFLKQFNENIAPQIKEEVVANEIYQVEVQQE